MLVNIIRIFHFFILIFLLFAPFYSKKILIFSIALIVYIFYKWKIDGSCFLTKVEYYLSGNKEEKGFIYRLINPMLNIEEYSFHNKLEVFTVIWLLLLILIYIIKYIEV
jgi:hypothetical protein